MNEIRFYNLSLKLNESPTVPSLSSFPTKMPIGTVILLTSSSGGETPS